MKSRRRRTLAAALGLLLLGASAPASAGRLDDVRQETSGDSGSSSGDTSSSSSSSSGGSSGGSGVGASIGASIGEAIGEAIGQAIAQAIAEREHRVRYRPHPYADRQIGFVFWERRETVTQALDEDELDAPADPTASVTEDEAVVERGRFWALNLGLEGAFLPTDTLRGGMHTRLMLGLFELNSSWSYLHEFDIRDRLVLGDLNLGVGLGARHLHFHAGAGPSFMIDPTIPDVAARTLVGVNFLSTRLDVFPIKPLVLKLGGDVGRLRAANYWRLRASLGATLGRIELFAGYEHLQVGAVPLGGPMVGLVVWL